MKKQWNLNLYHKFALTIVLVGLIPMGVLVSFVAGNMVTGYRQALYSQYEQAADYVTSAMESMLDTYNSSTKNMYYYNYSEAGSGNSSYQVFDVVRKILFGEIYEPSEREEERNKDMEEFMDIIGSTAPHIQTVHFVPAPGVSVKQSFHWSAESRYFKNEAVFLEDIQYDSIDLTSNKMILIPTHGNTYMSGTNGQVFTVGRNYFDLRGDVGHTPCVGTIFIDVNMVQLKKIFNSIDFSGNDELYVINPQGDCFYSTREDLIGKNVSRELGELKDTRDQMVLHSDENKYGLSVVIRMNTKEAFSNIWSLQKLMYLIIAVSILALFGASTFFSQRLTKPMHEMMHQMEQLENGNFDIQLPIQSTDEIGILSQRFNQMSTELKNYINESYVARIRQNEAELTAIKSQIYPHFLYNTLEIIRMTALEDRENKVPEMIEALAQQIHYIIGPMQDMVPLDNEIDIVRKYVYLLNCRISGKVNLAVSVAREVTQKVPKLILQPIVENAYVHGLKQKNGVGNIMIDVTKQGSRLEISVMDNGVGMDEAAVKKIHALLEGDEPGIKNEYNWQSIGLKNVHDRVRFLYGEEYGIDVTSTPGVGTIVRITIPWIQEEDKA